MGQQTLPSHHTIVIGSSLCLRAESRSGVTTYQRQACHPYFHPIGLVRRQGGNLTSGLSVWGCKTIADSNVAENLFGRLGPNLVGR